MGAGHMDAQQAVGDGVSNDVDQAVPFAQAKSPAVLAERSAPAAHFISLAYSGLFRQADGG